MLNSAQDNNVLTKCNKESNFPINFQPTPKRFIAWDKHKKDWVTKFLMPSTSDEDSDDYTCPLTLGVDTKGEKNWLNNDQLIVCQSTNLFDKDGKEIFEGSIVRGQVFDDSRTRIVGVVVYRQQAFWIMNINETHSEPLLEFSENELENISHILSNPALLQEEE